MYISMSWILCYNSRNEAGDFWKRRIEQILDKSTVSNKKKWQELFKTLAKIYLKKSAYWWNMLPQSVMPVWLYYTFIFIRKSGRITVQNIHHLT